MNRKKMIPEIAVISLSSPLEVGADKASVRAAEISEILKKRNCEVVLNAAVSSASDASEAGRKLAGSGIDSVVFVPVSWFEDYLVLDFLEECRVPLLLWSIPGMETGALCGAQQTGAFLRYLDVSFYNIFAVPEDKNAADDALKFLRAATLNARLRRAKIGMAGTHVNGMTHTSVFEFALKKSIGPRVVQLHMPDIISYVGSVSAADASSHWEKFKNDSGACCIKESAGLEAMRFYLSLRETIAKNSLNALTIGCYPHFMGKFCLASSLLADEGIPLACEGDVNGAAGQLILSLLSGGGTHCTDFLDPLEDGSVVFSHCGSGSLSLAESKDKIVLNSVRLMGSGACVLFPAKPGPVTMLSLMPGDDGYSVAMLNGEALETEMVFPGNPVRVCFEKSFKDINQWIFDEGIGHHWMIAYGDLRKEITHWSRIGGCRLKKI